MKKIDTVPLEREFELALNLLVCGSEDSLPENVKTVIEFCVKNEIGFVLSRNSKAFSCRDARSKRNRLGHIGIPLHDELKSILFKGIDILSKQEKFLMVHCRGHLDIDVNKLVEKCCLTGRPEIVDEEEMNVRFGMVHGIVNPFLVQGKYGEKVIHVVDMSVLTPITEFPGTMLTNAGDHTWGIEFDPSCLPKALAYNPDSLTDVSIPASKPENAERDVYTKPRSIGIITGNGPDSGMSLWKKINNHFTQMFSDNFSGDFSLPIILTFSLPSMGMSMELEKRNSATWSVISDAVTKLKMLDVELLVLACHTTHYYTEKIRELFEDDNHEFVSMAEETVKYIERHNINDVAILGINYVADLQGYSAYKALSNINVEKLSLETLEKFHDLGYEIKKMKNSQAAFQKFVSLLKKEVVSENVIIALTELSLIYESQKKKGNEKKIIDPLDIYAKAIAHKSLGYEER